MRGMCTFGPKHCLIEVYIFHGNVLILTKMMLRILPAVIRLIPRHLF